MKLDFWIIKVGIDNYYQGVKKGQQVIKMKLRKPIAIIIACAALMVLFAACSTNYEKELLGEWYNAWGYKFELFSDGTCDIRGEYGTGTWAVVNENQLKVTNFYGEVVELRAIESIKDGHIVFEDGYELWDEMPDD